MATAEAELQRVEAKLRNETGVAQAQRDFDIKKGAISYFSYNFFIWYFIEKKSSCKN